MENEKEYCFVRAKSSTDLEYVCKKESELTQDDLNLLCGEFVYNYDKLPPKAQDQVKQYIYNK